MLTLAVVVKPARVVFEEYHCIIYTCKPFVILISLWLLCYTGPPRLKKEI